MRYLITRWTTGGVFCIFGSDDEKSFQLEWKKAVKEYHPENARFLFYDKVTVFSFPESGRKDVLTAWLDAHKDRPSAQTVFMPHFQLKKLY